jgi:mannose-6-phosphate isomerase-like protein (cupin superfamily)
MPAIAQDKGKPAAMDTPKAAAEKKASEGMRKVLVDNDKVLVTEVSYKPGEASAMRERGPRVTRALRGGTMERTYADGKKETVEWKAGDVKYSPKGTFVNKNVGKTEVVLFVTTLK